MSTETPVILFDGNNLLYRMYHAVPPRIHDGERVESVQGAIGTIIKTCAQYNHQAICDAVVTFDTEKRTFRHDLDANYKADRKGMPEELVPQKEWLRQALGAMGMRVIQKPGFEADDVLGMLARYYAAQGRMVLVVTTDKDMTQIINDRVTIFNPASKRFIDRAAVHEKFGVPPEKVAEILALLGDASDGIKGVHKVGAKTASNMINEYGSLEGLINNADKVKGKVGEYLRDTLDQLRINLKMTTIYNDPDLLDESDHNALSNPSRDISACKELSQRIGMEIMPTGNV